MKKTKKLGEILLDTGLIDAKTLMNARDIQKIESKKLGQVLIGMGVVDDVEIANALAVQKRLPFVRLHNKKIPKDLIELIPADLAQKDRVVPIKKTENRLYIATSDPLDMGAADDVRFVTQQRVFLAVTPERDIEEALEKFYPKRDIKEDLGFGVSDRRDIEVVQRAEDEDDDADELLNLGGLPPVVRFTNAILAEAITSKASDVHIEPQKDVLVIRNRIDGVMKESLRTEKHIHPSVVSRIKIISNLDISIRRKPQDGKAQVKYGGKPFDLRVSTIPTSYGEKITIRILNPDTAQLIPEQLGFNDTDLSNLINAIQTPQGIVLVTGPTGSGKSSTLYACLKKLNKPDVNIITVEDPVEFDVGGINQVQINPKAGITFAAGLRSILRQDPDIVMVGEIRDGETARIAFQAAQTGHLVLSTLHTNDAPSAVTRLMDLGIEDFMISGSLLAVIGQRLARRICAKCKEEHHPDPQLLRRIRPNLEGNESASFFKGAGCEECHNSGYSGRLGIFEVLVVTPNLSKLIKPGISSLMLKEAAARDGFRIMVKDGVRKALDGLTTLEEVFRVAAPEADSEPSETMPSEDSEKLSLPPKQHDAKYTEIDAKEKSCARQESFHQMPSAEEEPPAFEDEPPALVFDDPEILVVDDNRVIREMLTKVLEASKYRVTAADNGVEAFSIAEKGNYSLIITDLFMPEMDGFELIGKLKQNERTKNIPVMMLTSKDEVESEVRVIDAGADDYLVKPVNARLFMARVQRLLRRY